MRYLLLILFFALQTFGYGANAIDLQKNDVENVLTSNKSSEEKRSYDRFRYYSPDIGMYISQDPIGLEGGMPNLYSYVHNSNSFVDPLGLVLGKSIPSGDWNYHSMPKIDGFQLHHVLPKSLKEGAKPHDIFKIADNYNVHQIKNTIYLPTDRENHPIRSIHDGYDRFHGQYNRDMRASLDDILSYGKENNWSKAQFKNAIDELVSGTRQDLRQGKLKLNCKG